VQIDFTQASVQVMFPNIVAAHIIILVMQTLDNAIALRRARPVRLVAEHRAGSRRPNPSSSDRQRDGQVVAKPPAACAQTRSPGAVNIPTTRTSWRRRYRADPSQGVVDAPPARVRYETVVCDGSAIPANVGVNV